MHISELIHLRNDKRIKFKEEIVNEQLFTIVSYMIADTELWKLPLATECRGITFNSAGICVSRPFEKFFSLGENEKNLLHNVKDNVVEVFEKRDGSLATPVLIGDEIVFKTKKSFFSDVANLANARIPDNIKEFCKICCSLNQTPIFEFTCDEFPIVLHYDNANPFTLLAIRHNETGEYSRWNVVEYVAETYNVPTVVKFDKLFADVLADQANLKNFEGYVLILKDGSRVKVKTAWYLANHRLKTELRERDVAELVADEKIDDIKISITEEGLDMEPVLRIEHQVVSELSALREQAEQIAQDCVSKAMSAKDVALMYKDHILFGLIMGEYNKRDVDYVKFWRKNYLPTYNLRCVYNKSF
jgi:T4 RnlA family RNA ligase